MLCRLACKGDARLGCCQNCTACLSSKQKQPKTSHLPQKFRYNCTDVILTRDKRTQVTDHERARSKAPSYLMRPIAVLFLADFALAFLAAILSDSLLECPGDKVIFPCVLSFSKASAAGTLPLCQSLAKRTGQACSTQAVQQQTHSEGPPGCTHEVSCTQKFDGMLHVCDAAYNTTNTANCADQRC